MCTEAACLRNAEGEEDPLWCKSHFFPQDIFASVPFASIPPTAWWEWTERWRTVAMWYWLHNNIQLLWKDATHHPLEEQLGRDSKDPAECLHLCTDLVTNESWQSVINTSFRHKMCPETLYVADKEGLHWLLYTHKKKSSAGFMTYNGSVSVCSCTVCRWLRAINCGLCPLHLHPVVSSHLTNWSSSIAT